MGDVGRKAPIKIMWTKRLLEKVDAIARREQEARGNAEPNRSEVVRRLVMRGLEAEGEVAR